MIARSDYIPEHRRSVTVVTSTFSSGEPGPLGICIADSFLKQDVIDEFNAKYRGRCLLFRSQSTSHFMTGETFVLLLHQLVGPALMLQRERLKVAPDTQAPLLCDAWTGFHSRLSGLDSARAGWSQQWRCHLPEVQARSLPNWVLVYVI